MKISLVMPPGTGARTGNHHTAQRWAGFLRKSGHRVSIEEKWSGASADALIALHARKSAASVEKFHDRYPERPLIVALTGTDLYRDIEDSAEARRTLELASRLVVLQPGGRSHLARSLRAKTRVIFQSSATRLTHRPVRDRFRVIVVGNLREEKDPFRSVAALAHLSPRNSIELVQIGASLAPEMAKTAKRWMQKDSRYRWTGSRPHAQALREIASSHLLVVSSVMEGGANVICEASRIGVPVLASRVSGNIGMLGAGYPGYFALFDDRKLARLIGRAIDDRGYYAGLKRAVLARRPLFAPPAERHGLDDLLGEFG
jgi:putative glycosyltransferase (TIGR04348 family)